MDKLLEAKRKMSLMDKALSMPRKEFIADFLVQATKRKADRKLVGGYQVKRKGKGYVIYIDKLELATARDADSLYERAFRGLLNYYVRQAEDLRADAYAMK